MNIVLITISIIIIKVILIMKNKLCTGCQVDGDHHGDPTVLVLLHAKIHISSLYSTVISIVI
jgi:hypothetical protein